MGIALVMVAPACGGDHSRATTTNAVPFVAINPNSKSASDHAIAVAQKRLEQNVNDDHARVDLAVAFLQKVRETADPSLYTKAQGLLDDVAHRLPNDLTLLVAQGTLALALHRFDDAARIGAHALEVAPDTAAAYGILVDANNELGRYDAALDATQHMVDVRPNLASLSRVSYARELRGDLPGAIEAMQQAITAADTKSGENIAYVQTLLGQLLLTSGDLRGADREFGTALQNFPGFPAARAGQAQVLVAREQFARAARILDTVVKVQPLAQYASALGDALSAAGKPDEAERAYGLVDVTSKLFESAGVQLDLEIALFDAEHHPGKDAVAIARRALAARPSSLGHDVLAWNLFQIGQLDEAAKESQAALALGSRDPQARYHAAAIKAARGDRTGAAADLRIVLAENPRFNARLIPKVADLARSLSLAMPPVMSNM
jgi:tetratricopeptide (TPR) repeat protein